MDRIEVWTDVITSVGVIISLIFGLIGMVFTQQQISLSNKQALFDKRYECYRLLTHIHSLCEHNLRLINTEKKERCMAVDFVTSLLTNSVDFYKMTNIFNNDASQTDKVTFLSGVEFLQDKSLQASFLFPKEQADFIANYFSNYSNLLNELYKYKCLLDNIKDIPKYMIGTQSQIAEEQRKMLHGELADELLNNIDAYKGKLEELNEIYSSNIAFLSACMTLIPMQMTRRIEMKQKKDKTGLIFKIGLSVPQQKEIYKDRMEKLSDKTLNNFTPISMATTAKEELKNKLAIEEWVNSYVGAAKELAQLNQDRCNGGKTRARYVLCKYNYTLPTVFLIRHAAELAIKEAIDKSGKEPNNSTHDLDKLWSSLLSQLPKSKTQTDRQIINQAHKFLQYISHLDNDGTKVRYPVDKNGNYTHAEFEWIDCIKLSNTLDAFVTTLRSIDWEHVKASKGKETKKEG